MLMSSAKIIMLIIMPILLWDLIYPKMVMLIEKEGAYKNLLFL